MPIKRHEREIKILNVKEGNGICCSPLLRYEDPLTVICHSIGIKSTSNKVALLDKTGLNNTAKSWH
jgi:hypothetical protein